MTPRRKAGTSSALVPIGENRNLPASFRERFSDFRKQQNASTPGPLGMPTIRASGGTFTFPGAPASVEMFKGVVLCALRRNTFWEGRYTPGSEEPPVCMAIADLGQHENMMAPTEGCPKPQAVRCAVCAQNVAPQKACRNGLDLVLLHESSLGDAKTAAQATLARLRISSTGIAPFAQSVRLVNEYEMPLFAALLEFRQEQADGASYFTTFATPIAWLPEDVIEALADRVREGADELIRAAQPVPVADDGEGKPSTTAAIPRRKKKATKKGGRRKL